MSFTSNDIDRLTGATVRTTEGGKIGSIGQVYVDPEGAPNWATVKTGLFGSSESFFPLDRATLAGDDLQVPFDKDVVKGAPRVEVDGELNDDETERLYDYYADHSTGGQRAATRGTGVGSVNTSGETETTKPHEGRDVSGPSTDDAMTRSEERLHVGTKKVESGRARLRKHIVTEQQTVTVPVTHEEATIVREPITAANIGDATAGADLSEEEHEVVLHSDRIVTSKETVAVERVRLGTEQVSEQQQVTEDVRKEQIDYIDPDGTPSK